MRDPHAALSDLAVPHDLLHAVISALWTDSAEDSGGAIECWRTLRAVTLVSRRWHNVAQARFEGLLPSLDIAMAWRKAVTARDELGQRGRVVKVLHLDDCDERETETVSRDIVRACPSITHLASFDGSEWEASSDGAETADGTALRMLSGLYIRHAAQATLVTLPNCALRRLKIFDCDFGHDDDTGGIPLSLQLPDLVRENLLSLDIGLSNYSIEASIEPFLRQFPAIQRFAVSAIYPHELISAFTGHHPPLGITHLAVRLYTHKKGNLGPASLTAVALAAPRLRTITLGTMDEEHGVAAAEVWGAVLLALAKTLGSGSWPALESVFIDSDRPVGSADMAELRAVCGERGLVCV